MGMTTNIARIGNATSSQAYRVVGTKKVFDTYVKECNMEREFMRSIDKEENARTLTWGKLCEHHVSGIDLIGLEYRMSGDVTRVHDIYNWWAGSEDGEIIKDEGNGVLEFKAPYTMKSFYNFAKAIKTQDADEVRNVTNGYAKDGEKYYWQMVSNACLMNVDWAELCVYMPFEIELDAIRETAGQMENLNDYAWVNWGSNDQLPHLKHNGNFMNMNKIRFDIPKEDKELLESRMIDFGAKLIPYNADFDSE